MLTKKLQEAAGNASNPVYVEEVFSTYLYTGDGNNRSITNNIDVSTKGGLVWIKDRTNGTYGHMLYDTARGKSNGFLHTNTTEAQYGAQYGLTAFNTDGFSIDGNSEVNQNSSHNYTSWTFRKQPKFFDVVTWTGNDVNGRSIPHSLGSVPGFIVVKRLNGASQWYCYHRSLGATQSVWLNSTNSAATIGTGYWNNTDPTSTVFTLSNAAGVNGSGNDYVAYIFAHNAGGFGLTGADNVISCGSYTGTGSAGNTISLGYEPQWVLIKSATEAKNWLMFDTMRGMTAVGSGIDEILYANLSNAADATNSDMISPTATGFSIDTNGTYSLNTSGATYIYMAIRRGPMKVPTDATKVFNPVAFTGAGTNPSTITTDFPPDLFLSKRTDSSSLPFFVTDRLRGGTQVLSTSNVIYNAEATDASWVQFDKQTSIAVEDSWLMGSGAVFADLFFRRAPSFFDVVCYTGNGSGTYNINHNLGVTPEILIIKDRSAGGHWSVYLPNADTFMTLSAVNGKQNGSPLPSAVTSTTFNVGSTTGYASVAGRENNSGDTYVAYLFATLAGVSKVGSYTGNGSSQTINCGFTGGARFVLIKRTDTTGDWYVWDTARGIVSGNDPHLSLNTSAVEVTSDDTLDPDSSGFIVNQVSATNVNVSSATYIYLAIA